MRKAGCFLVLSVGLLVLTGCGNSADGLIERQISDTNKLAEAIESGASENEIAAIKESLEKTSKSLEDLDLSEADKEALEKKYAKEIAVAQEKLLKAMAGKMSDVMGKAMENMVREMPTP